MEEREELLDAVEESLRPWGGAVMFNGGMNGGLVREALSTQGYSLVITTTSEGEFAYAGQAVRLLITDAMLRGELHLRNSLRNRFVASGWSGDVESRCWTRLREQLPKELNGRLWDQARNSAVSRLLLTERLREAARRRLGERFDRLLGARIAEHAARAWRPIAPLRALLREQSPAPDVEMLCWDLWDLALYYALRPLFPGTRSSPFLGDWLEPGRIGAGFACLWSRIAVVLSMPQASLDERGRLHSASGPSVSWPVGGGRYFHWRGVRVPEKVILHPEQLTRLDLSCEPNSEVSRAMAERLGWQRYLELAKARPVDAWKDEATGCGYELYAVKNDAGPQMPLLLKMESPQLKDGTRPSYVEPVPATVESCRAARKWQFRKPDGTWPSVHECNQDPALQFHDEA